MSSWLLRPFRSSSIHSLFSLFPPKTKKYESSSTESASTTAHIVLGKELVLKRIAHPRRVSKINNISLIYWMAKMKRFGNFIFRIFSIIRSSTATELCGVDWNFVICVIKSWVTAVRPWRQSCMEHHFMRFSISSIHESVSIRVSAFLSEGFLNSFGHSANRNANARVEIY